MVVLASRIRDEEKMLAEELAGYREYTLKVRHRLVDLPASLATLVHLVVQLNVRLAASAD